MIKISNTIRDFLFLGLLLFMIRVALNRQKVGTLNPVLYAPAKQERSHELITNNDKASTCKEQEYSSCMYHANENKQQIDLASEQAFTVHEQDENLVDSIMLIQKHVAILLDKIPHATEQEAQLQSISQRLTQLKKECQITSPAIALLGPIGTTGIVIKENEIEKNLLQIINHLRLIINEISPNAQAVPIYQSIAYGIKYNTELINQFFQEEHV